VIPYNIITRTVSGYEGNILIMLWRENKGGTDTNFSSQQESLHYLTAAITPGKN
jgi:hypothetical protein